MSGKCISHFKMLWIVSGSYYGEVALTSPFFLFFFCLLFYLLQVNSRVILTLLLGFRLVRAPSSMSYEAIIGSYSCRTIWTTFSPIPNWGVFPFIRRRWLLGRIIFTCFYSKFNDPSITQSHSWGNWSKGFAEAADADPPALVFLPEGSPLGGLFWGRRLASADLIIAWISTGFGLVCLYVSANENEC